MKKAFILVAAIAMIAAPVFAEVTVSGDFKAEVSSELTAGGYSESFLNSQNEDNDISFSFDTNVGEFTTISAGVNAEAGNDVTLDEMSITQDITGALGVDAPVSLSITVGNSNFEAVRPVDENDPVALIGGDFLDINLAIGIMDMVTLGLGFVPASYTTNGGEAPEFGVTLDGVFGPATAAVSFMYTDAYDGTEDTAGLKGTGLEINFLVDLAPLTIKEQFQVYNLNDDDGVGTEITNYTKVEYALDMGLTAGAKFVMDKDGDADAVMGAGVDVKYALTDALTADADFGVTDFSEAGDNMEWGAGLEAVLDGATYRVGYDGEIVAGADATATIAFSIKGSF